MPSPARRLQDLAEHEVAQVLAALPAELQGPAKAIPILSDARSFEALSEEGLGDTMGLFVGENMMEAGQGSGGLPAQIILYLENIWWEAEEDEQKFQLEVRATLLHELGHYLGLEEIDLQERGL